MSVRLIVLAALLTAVAVINVVTETRLARIGADIQREHAEDLRLREQTRRMQCEISRLKAPRALKDRAFAFDIDFESPGYRAGPQPAFAETFVAGAP